jgi:hypothetical protein
MQSEFSSFVRMCQTSHYKTLSTFLDKRASLELHNSNRNYFYHLLSKAQLVTQVRGRPILIYKPKSLRLLPLRKCYRLDLEDIVVSVKISEEIKPKPTILDRS